MPQKLKSKPGRENKLQPERLNLPVAFTLKNALIRNGYKGLQLEFLLTQAASESGGFNSDNGTKEFNFGGIKWTKRMKILKPSTIFLAPAREDKKRRIPYVHFKDMDQYAHYWPITASLDTMIHDNKIGPPLKAKTIEEFAHRVTLNHYSQVTEAKYLAGLKIWDPIVKKELLQNPARTMLPGIRANNDLDLSAYIKRHVMVSDKARLAQPYIQNHPFAPAKKKENGLINNVNKLFGFDTIQNMPALMTGNTVKKRRAGYAKPNGLPQMITAVQQPLLYKNNTKDWKSQNGNTSLINYPYNNWHDIPLNDFLNIMPAPGSGIFNNTKTNKKPGTMLMPAGIQENGVDMQQGAGSNSKHAVNIHLNTPLIGQLTIHTNSANDGINNLKNKIEEVLLEVLNSSGAIA